MIAKKDVGTSVPEWVITFADLMSLLFCFFVLLTTLSTQPKNCTGIQNYLTQNRRDFKNYELRSTKLKCILSLPSDYLFSSGSDVVQRKGLNSLAPMFSAIKKMDEHKNDLIIVEGHTDDVPIKTKKFPSNWELSSARATNIATFLVNTIDFPNDRVSVSAYADSRPKDPYTDTFGSKKRNDALQEARKTNRRVEIILANQPKSRDETTMLFDGR
ncbi:OmpA family protein [bacterium]|nr:OmpA family protein [bacterium]